MGGQRTKNSGLKDKRDQKYKTSQKGGRSGASDNPDRKLTQKQISAPMQFMRSKQTINRLRMQKAKPDYEKMWEIAKEPARIDPNRKWFGNIRTIDQDKLETFRKELAKRVNDPRSVLIKAKTLPLSLLVEPEAKPSKVNILDLETYADTFGPKSKRKRVKLNPENLEEFMDVVKVQDDHYDLSKDQKLFEHLKFRQQKECKDKRLSAGQSKRIWEELYKVVDSSDVLCQIVDARDPMGTRCKHLEQHIKKNCPHKHMVLILNKCDLIPTWLTSRWVSYLSKEYPTIAFHAHINKPFGKGAFINLLRQFDKFHQDKQTMSVGFVGYPNVGKSSVINSLKKRKVCKAAPIPGETRVWQYVALTKRIYLIDCPGVVYMNDGKDEVEVVMKGCVRAEKLNDPTFYIPALLNRVKPEILIKLYKIENFEDDQDFLKQVGRKKGKLLRGGEPDISTTAKLILMDWQRGEIPFYNLPPDYDERKEISVESEIDEQELEKMMIKKNMEVLRELKIIGQNENVEIEEEQNEQADEIIDNLEGKQNE